MLGIARRAGASKETLYAWFGGRAGHFAALIEEHADVTASRSGRRWPAEQTLVPFATGLLTLRTGERSIVLNRAGSPLSFQLFGLVSQVLQIRLLLGEPPSPSEAPAARARQAAAQLMTLRRAP